MKSINTMKFIVEYTKQITDTLEKIDNSETYEEAKRIGNYAMGLVDGMVIFTNTMICLENNDFTAEMGDVEEDWRADIYQAVADVADRTKQSNDKIIKLLSLRDEHRKH